MTRTQTFLAVSLLTFASAILAGCPDNAAKPGTAAATSASAGTHATTTAAASTAAPAASASAKGGSGW